MGVIKMQDKLTEFYSYSLRQEIKLLIDLADNFHAINTHESARKKEYIEIYETRVMYLLNILQSNSLLTPFTYAKFITSDERIYKINSRLQG